MKTFKEIINEAKITWYAEEDSLSKYGAGYSSVNVYYDKDGYNGYGKNKQGDVDARGFGPTKSLEQAGKQMLKEFKLSSYDIGMATYVLSKAKEMYEKGIIIICMHI